MSSQFARLRGALDRVGTTTPGTIVGVFAEDLTAIMNHYVEVVKEAAELKAARAQPAQAVPATCGECGKKASDGWALYCVACMEKAGLPAQAGQALTDEEIDAAYEKARADYQRSRFAVRGQQLTAQDSPDWWFARAIEQAVLAKRVPMTEAQINDAYGHARVQHDHIPHDDVVRIVRAAERHHGIGEKA